MGLGASEGIVVLTVMCFMGYVWWRIVKKTGFHPALGLLILVPVVNLIMMAFLAFKEWPIDKKHKKN